MGVPASLTGKYIRNRSWRSSFRICRTISARAVSMTDCSSQPSADSGLTTTTSGPSGSLNRLISASRMAWEARYWLSI